MESDALFTNWFNIRINSDMRFGKRSANILNKKILTQNRITNLLHENLIY